jgi:hypothetical protein
VKPIDNEAAIESHELPDFDRAREALVEQDALGQLSPGLMARAGGSAGSGTATITSYSNNRVRLEVSADREGLLVLHDLYYPGWEATVDGVRVPVVKANILFRGVEVPAGEHIVEFTFRPFSPRNLLASASGLLHRGED